MKYILSLFLLFPINVYAISIATHPVPLNRVPITAINKNFIKTFLPYNPVIIEAGAYDGQDSIEMSILWPEATIYSFEPIPDLFDKLKTKTQQYTNIHCLPYALGNYTGKASMYVSTINEEIAPSSSLLPPKDHLSVHQHIKFTKTIEVDMLTLDDWAALHGINHIDFLWLDMQGAELAMLKASPYILTTVQVIFTEVSGQEMYKNVPLYPEVKEWLEKIGFIAIARDGALTSSMGNVLFVRETVLKTLLKK